MVSDLLISPRIGQFPGAVIQRRTGEPGGVCRIDGFRLEAYFVYQENEQAVDDFARMSLPRGLERGRTYTLCRQRLQIVPQKTFLPAPSIVDVERSDQMVSDLQLPRTFGNLC